MFSEKTILIHGPLNSLTKSMAMNFTEMGASTVFVFRDDNGYKKFLDQVNDQSHVNEKMGKAHFIQAECTNEEEAKNAISEAAQHFGAAEVFIDLAYENEPSPLIITSDSKDQLIDRFDKNLFGTIYLTKHLLPFMAERKKGKILYLMPEGAKNGYGEDTLLALSRTGLVSFAKSLAESFCEKNIYVNTLSVGFSEEYIVSHFPECQSIKEQAEKLKNYNRMARLADSDKVVKSLLFFSSNDCQVISGQSLSVF